MKIWVLFGVFGAAIFADNILDESKEANMQELFEVEYQYFIETGIKTNALQSLMKLMKAPTEFRTTEIENLSESKQSTMCLLCKSAAGVILKYRREGKDDDFMCDFALSVCMNLEIQPKAVCEALAGKMMKILLFIIDEKPELSASSICGVILQGSKCVTDGADFNWHVNINPNKEKISAPKSYIPASTKNDLTIVQLTDIHFDPDYKNGSLANCKDPLCCRRSDIKLTHLAEGAGIWGDYRNCDPPLNAVENAFEQVKKEHNKIDYIYFTGDYVHHGMWLTTIEGNKAVINEVNTLLKKRFRGVPVFPIVGNHEPDPLNIFPPEYIKEKGLEVGWLYEFLAKEWSFWLPKSALTTVRKGGYYTVTPRQGFRIIALNNNDCYTYNFWLLFDAAFMSNQLQWLQDTLFEAEAAGESVHILAHIPSGSSTCFNTWAREFRRIVDRYHKTINGIFNGHTHRDHFSVFYSKSEPSHPVNVAWNGGSISPFSFVNPNYRVYGVEPETYQVVHHETWIMNLTLANLGSHTTPIWYKEYTFKNAYDVKDLSPATLDNLLKRFATDKNLLQKYWSFSVKMGDPSLRAGCNDDCLKKLLCAMATTQSNDKERCNALLRTFSEKYN